MFQRWPFIVFLFFLPLAAQADYEQAVEAYNVGDIQKAHDLWLDEAEAGDAFSQYALGVLYHRGQLGEPDATKAVYWFQLAAKQDHLEAMHNLGIAYWEGHGVPRDYEQAYNWWRRGADLGYPPAQFNLAATYYMGRGVPRDLALAVAWFSRAADNGHQEAINAISMLQEKFPDAFPEESEPVQAEAESLKEGVGESILAETPAGESMDETPDSPDSEIAAAPETVAETPEPVDVSTGPTAAVGLGAQSDLSVQEEGAETQPPEPTATSQAGDETSVEMFAFPSDTAPVIGKTGTVDGLKVLRRQGEWLQVMAPEGAIVWVYGSYVEGGPGSGRVLVRGLRARPFPSTGPESTPLASLRYGDPVEVVEIQGDWKRVRVKGRVAGWVKQNEIGAAGEAIEQTAMVAPRPMDRTIYAFPRTDAPIIGEVPENNSFQVIRRTGQWAQVMAPGGMSVWVFGKYVDGDIGEGRVNVEGLRARPLPSTGPEAKPVGVLHRNDKVEIKEVQGDWKKVMVDARIAGWIQVEDVN